MIQVLRPRAVLLLAAFAALAWLLAQACTLAWQAARAEADLQRSAAGLPVYAWDLSDAGAVVARGSEGLDAARFDAEGLHVEPGTGVVDLSLALDGRPVAGASYGAAEVRLASEGRARVLLLAPAADGSVAVVAETAVDAGEHRLVLPLDAFAMAAGWLRMRVERSAAGGLLLRRLSLGHPHCDGRDAALPADCGPAALRELPWAWTPEAFLRTRDAAMAVAPAAPLVPAGTPRVLGRAWSALHATWFHGLALGLGLVVLGWTLRARSVARSAGSGDPSAAGSAAARADAGGARIELAVLLGVPMLVLLAGQPDRHDHPLVLLALLAGFAAALLHPGGRRDWRWLGDRAAWLAAARLTAVGLLVIAAITLLAGDRAGEWRPQRLPRYLAWALLQQALLLVAIMPRLLRGGGDPRLAAACAGGLFALFHLPNFGLMLATLVAGTAWALQGHRHGALLPLALSHAVLGSLLAWAATPWLLRSAEVGGRYCI